MPLFGDMEAHDGPPQLAQANGMSQHQQPQQHATAPPTDPAQYYLANYRIGKTLGIGSFGKVCLGGEPAHACDHRCLRCSQVKVAEHMLTNQKVAIKILNKRKIKQLDMEEKGVLLNVHPKFTSHGARYSAPRDQDPTAVLSPPHHPFV